MCQILLYTSSNLFDSMLVGLKVTQLEQQKTPLPFNVLANKKFKTNALQGHKRYIKIYELEINNLRVQILRAKMT